MRVILFNRGITLFFVLAGRGSIINTASMAAVANLTKYIATQYGKDKIRCNAVASGISFIRR